MAAVTFDTLKFVQTLETAGVVRDQAVAFATAVRDVQSASDLATKTDLHALETRTDGKFDLLRKDFASMELGLRKDIDMLRNELIIKLSAVMIACVGAIGLMIRFM